MNSNIEGVKTFHVGRKMSTINGQMLFLCY